MKAFILLVAFIALAGCGHTHPIAEHEHPHEHDHTHDSEAVALHEELVGKYRLETYNDGRDWLVENAEEMRGELTIELDHKFEFVIEQDYNFDSEWESVRPFYPADNNPKYYKIQPHRSAIFAYSSKYFFMRYHSYDTRWNYGVLLEYKWDGTVLTLIWHSLTRDNRVTMKWRKLR